MVVTEEERCALESERGLLFGRGLCCDRGVVEVYGGGGAS